MKIKMLDFDLGSHSFRVSTVSADAQRLFDLGLNWCFSFNQEEGLACFKKSAGARSKLRHATLGHRLCGWPILQYALDRFQ